MPAESSPRSRSHQAYRAQLIAAWKPGDPCARCKKPMWHKDQLELGHTDDRTAYTGLEHRHCNLDAAIRAKGKRPPRRDALGEALPPPPRVMPSADARGYDREHRALRLAMLVQLRVAPGRPCRRCTEPMWPWEHLDLGHPDTTQGWYTTDLEHATCNRGKRTPGQARPRPARTTRSSPGRTW